MSMDAGTAALIASFFACAATTLGIITISRRSAWANANAPLFVAFAAGVLTTLSLIHLIPEALEMNGTTPFYILGGFFGFYLLDTLLDSHAEEDPGIVSVVGIGLHSFLDGVIFAVTFNVSLFIGALAAIGMVLHEFPEGVITYVFLERSGLAPRRSALYAFLVAALSTPLGSLVALPFVNRIGEETLGLLLAMAAGALLYVGASHLLPRVGGGKRKYTLASLAAGVAVALVISFTHH